MKSRHELKRKTPTNKSYHHYHHHHHHHHHHCSTLSHVMIRSTWRFGLAVLINEVTLRRAWLVLGWVTGPGSTASAGNLSQYIISHPGQIKLAICNEYRPKGSDALQLGSKGRHGSYVGGRQNCVISYLTRAISKSFRDEGAISTNKVLYKSTILVKLQYLSIQC